MNSDPKPVRRRSRGLILTDQALKALDQELRKQWAEQPPGKRCKLTRDEKGTLLGLDAKTVDKLYRRIGVDEISLRTAFDKLNITPRFSKELYCVSAPPPSGNLPYVSTPCIGREIEVTKIKALLKSTSLVTLTGTGGVGKTRLAIQVAEEMKSDFAAGIWFVELAGVSDQALVPQAVATTLGVQEEKLCPLIQTLSDFLRGKQLLLILDNCEHLPESCAKLADGLLSSSSRLKVLVTSRQRLNLRCEHPFRVPSLTTPDLKHLSTEQENLSRLLQEYDSVRLFVEHARVQRPDFTITNQNARIVALICHRLDGIPLAIELAAARVRAMPLADLERGLNNCFHILTGGSITALPRHQTLRATMDWSYALLQEKEKSLFHSLAVFADGCQREAAEQVCALFPHEILDLLTSLVDKSLVVYKEREEKGRYYLLETVRQYARERLIESGKYGEAQVRHRDYFLALAEEAEVKLKGMEESEWLQRLEEEHENLRAALAWSLKDREGGKEGKREGEEETMQRHRKGMRDENRVLSFPPSLLPSSLALRFCGALQRFWYTRGHLSEGREWCRKALQKADVQKPTAERAKALKGAGVLAYYQGDLIAARPSLEESLTIYREIGDLSGVAYTLNALGFVVSNQGNSRSARDCYEESLVLFRELGDRIGIANSLIGLGSLAHPQGDLASAHRYFEESLAIRRELGDRSGIANSLNNLGAVAHSQGNYASARDFYEECLVLCRKMRARSRIAYALNSLGLVVCSQGDYVAARDCYEEALVILRELGDWNGVAYSLYNLGGVSESQGHYRAARDFYEESLSLFREIGNQSWIAVLPEALAGLAARESKMERAAVLWGAGEAIREAIGSPLPPGEREAYDSAVAKACQALGEEAFSAAWARGRSMPLEQVIKYALEAPV